MSRKLLMAFRLGASVFLLACIVSTSARAQENTNAEGVKEVDISPAARTSQATRPPLQPVDTSSPRATLESFVRLAREGEEALWVYRNSQSRATAEQIVLLGDQFEQLLDLSSVPAAARREARGDAVGFLMDIIGRVQLPPIESVPDADAFEDDGTPAKWKIPGTLITISRIEEGPREHEFLFSARTLTRLPALYERIKHLPLRSSTGIESWQLTLRDFHGPLIPAKLVAELPDRLKQPWLGTPIWKVFTIILLGLFDVMLIAVWHRLTRPRTVANRTIRDLLHLLTPAAIILVAVMSGRFVTNQLNLHGTFAIATDVTLTVAIYLAAAWTFWLIVGGIFEWIIQSPKIPDESLDADLLRLTARLIGFLGGAIIITYGAQAVGIPAFGVLAGLGIGGLAVALAIRPTLENLIAGVILYIDKPVRIGDFCTFGDYIGEVERIGLRSTQIRALDRTIVTVPNAHFADMNIVNWARCDMMLIGATISLRYETEPDQLRYVLAKLRAMGLAHPRIDNETVRVRFAGYGDSSLDVAIRFYALTHDWNDFYAIREDVFLRVNEIVRESGASFAFPSRALYLNRDGGPDTELGDAAIQQVHAWRRSGELPFPYMAQSQRDRLMDTLDYPPTGSPDSKATDMERAEPLSKETEPAEKPTESNRR